MTSFLHWSAIAVGGIVIVGGFVLFWRGLGFKPHPPDERPPERWGGGV
jgi:hypothetical protein